jgi:hypothetical protein
MFVMYHIDVIIFESGAAGNIELIDQMSLQEILGFRGIYFLPWQKTEFCLNS